VARYVLDASVVLALVLREGYHQVDQFFRGRLQEDDILAPLLLYAECTSVIHENVARGRVTSDEIPTYLADLFDLDLELTAHEGQFRLAPDLARQFGHAKAYDMQYLAAAISENAILVTIDGGMRQAAINIKHPVRFLR